MMSNVRRFVWELEGAARGASVRIAADGRILVPAALRRAAGLEPGKSVTVRLEGGRLVLEDPETAMRALKELLAPLWEGGGSVVDELIADRRAEAARE